MNISIETLFLILLNVVIWLFSLKWLKVIKFYSLLRLKFPSYELFFFNFIICLAHILSTHLLAFTLLAMVALYAFFLYWMTEGLNARNCKDTLWWPQSPRPCQMHRGNRVHATFPVIQELSVLWGHGTCLQTMESERRAHSESGRCVSRRGSLTGLCM